MEHYKSTYEGAEVDAAIAAALAINATLSSALTPINNQLATIGSKLGDLANLRTTDKTSAVNAINEIDSKIKPSISSTEIAIDIDGTKAASIEHFDSSLFDNVPTYDEVCDIVDENVVNNFDSDSATKSLSAGKGKELNSKITPTYSSADGISTDIDGTKSASLDFFDSSLLDNLPTYDEVHDIVEEEVVDSLDSDATNKPLSASKGKELNGRITPEIGYVGGISTDIDGTKSVSPEYFDSSLIENVPTYDELVDINTNIYLYPRTIHIPQWPNIFYTYHPLYEEVTLTSNNKLINII